MIKQRLLQLFFILLSISMFLLVVVTSLQSNLWEALAELTKHPWFNTTIVDFYFNTAIISAWVLYRERNIGIGLLWVSSFICLGSITTALYVAIQFSSWRQNGSFEDVLVRRR